MHVKHILLTTLRSIVIEYISHNKLKVYINNVHGRDSTCIIALSVSSFCLQSLYFSFASNLHFEKHDDVHMYVKEQYVGIEVIGTPTEPLNVRLCLLFL